MSVDSRHCHANWGVSVGGVSFPLLSDFHPKGAVAQKYGMYLEKAGITDRATVLIDAAGKVLYAESVTPSGQRDMPKLVDEMIAKVADYSGAVEKGRQGSPPGEGVELYVKNSCGFSRAVLAAQQNLHLDGIKVRNVSEDDDAKKTLETLTGKTQAPCLVEGKDAKLESADIIQTLVQRSTGFWSS